MSTRYQFQFQLTKDQMRVYFSAHPLETSKEGHILSRASILEFLRKNRIIFGIDENVIAKIIQKGYAQHELIAEGEMPLKGTDAYFETLLPDKAFAYQRAINTIELLLAGQVPFPNYDEIVVARHTPLVRKLPATVGAPGCNVLGEIVSGILGQDISFPKLKNVRVSEQDQNVLMAVKEGCPFIQLPWYVKIEPVFMVERNIDTSCFFKGLLIVKGSILDQVRVLAESDIIVLGTVEAAVVMTPEKLVIRSGVKGKNMAVLKSGDDLVAIFAEQCTLESQGNILLHNAVHSYIVSLGNIYSEHIIGGELWASGVIEADYLSAQTILHVGNNDYLDTRVNQLHQEIYLMESKLNTIQRQISHLVLKDKKREDDVYLNYLRYRVPQLEFQLEYLYQCLERLKVNLQMADKSEVRVYSLVGEGSQIFIRDLEYVYEEDDDDGLGIIFRGGNYGVILEKIVETEAIS